MHTTSDTHRRVHTQVLELKNIRPIKFDIRNSVLIKTSMLPAGGASLGTQSDMHSWECRSRDNLILRSPFIVVLVCMCLVTACVCLFHHCTRTICEQKSEKMLNCVYRNRQKFSYFNRAMKNDHVKNRHQ